MNPKVSQPFYDNRREDLPGVKIEPAWDQPWPFSIDAFRSFAESQFPNAAAREHELMAQAIYKWFYGEWK